MSEPLPNRHEIENAARIALGHAPDAPRAEAGPVAEALLVGFVIARGLFGVWLVIAP